MRSLRWSSCALISPSAWACRGELCRVECPRSPALLNAATAAMPRKEEMQAGSVRRVGWQQEGDRAAWQGKQLTDS